MGEMGGRGEKGRWMTADEHQRTEETREEEETYFPSLLGRNLSSIDRHGMTFGCAGTRHRDHACEVVTGGGRSSLSSVEGMDFNQRRPGG